MTARLPLRFKNPGRAKAGHGGRRAGAGRPNRSGQQGHTTRPALSTRHPVHVTLRLRAGLPSLRRKDVFEVLRDSIGVARKQGFAVVHFAILSDHLHFLIEPTSRRAFFSSMQSFEISFTRRLNRLLGRKGTAFADRYDLRILDSPSRARKALAYVLAYESRHRREKTPSLILGPYSSAATFEDAKALLGRHRLFRDKSWAPTELARWHAEILAPARTWLLRAGWKKAPAVSDS